VEKIKAVIIDDMLDAREVLAADLAKHCPEIEIIGQADSVVSGAKLLRNVKPDLIFLDILMGDGTGFDLLDIFPNMDAKLIFITASDEFAIKAFRFAAIDYLLKPLNTEELIQAVEKAKQQISTSPESISLLKETINNPTQLPTKISLHAQDKISVVDIDQIVRCESDGNNTIFVLADGDKIFVTKTLKSFDVMLAEHRFKRVHQSHLINIHFIQEYVRKEGGYLKMRNGDIVSVSVRKKAEVIEMLDNL
jgi:two-component system LytT family response regulator